MLASSNPPLAATEKAAAEAGTAAPKRSRAARWANPIAACSAASGPLAGGERLGRAPSSSASAAKAARWAAAAWRARRSQPRAVASGTPARPAAARWPRPAAASSSAQKIAAARSRRRAKRKEGSRAWVAPQERQIARAMRKGRISSRRRTQRR